MLQLLGARERRVPDSSWQHTTSPYHGGLRTAAPVKGLIHGFSPKPAGVLERPPHPPPQGCQAPGANARCVRTDRRWRLPMQHQNTSCAVSHTTTPLHAFPPAAYLHHFSSTIFANHLFSGSSRLGLFSLSVQCLPRSWINNLYFWPLQFTNKISMNTSGHVTNVGECMRHTAMPHQAMLSSCHAVSRPCCCAYYDADEDSSGWDRTWLCLKAVCLMSVSN